MRLLTPRLIAELVAPRPKTVWIELTSKCPFDCIFCSRKYERGNGEHMSFPLYQSLIGQLDRPEVIRLNYSGESMHYPQLGEAIRLARNTGATTELVSALASATQPAIESLVDAGLHRLSVSIHSMDSEQFTEIYRYRDIDDIRARLDFLKRYKAKRGKAYPEIDFAFVAMDQNLAQLRPLVDYAHELGVSRVSIHPVIHRSSAPLRFPDEVDSAGNLRGEFAERVSKEMEAVSAGHPTISISIARPHDPGRQPQGGITTCEQNPWDTMHILANGTVVICEVQDRVEIGNLNQQTLAGIWNVPKYQEFRRQYVNGSHPACSACPWRRTAQPSGSRHTLVRGWHASNGDLAEWSEASAAMAITLQPGLTRVRLEGMLPPAPEGGSNSLEIRQGGNTTARVVNETAALLDFETVIAASGQEAILQFETAHRYCPAERGSGPDLRNLGFALTGLTLLHDEKRLQQVSQLLDRLEQVERLAVLRPAMRWRLPRMNASLRRGVSIVIPARDTPELLTPTLTAAQAALAEISEPSEIIAVVSGAHPAAYSNLRARFPDVQWVLREQTLDYGPAVELGLARTRRPWVYLLNSDMHLQPRALAEVLELRGPGTFAIGSRIRMLDGSLTETNWTDLRLNPKGAAQLVERDPESLREARGCLYAGGGSGLFRASLLRSFIERTRAYAPFYWEDAEWGARAWRQGYRCLFCPASEAVHAHRQTIGRYYPDAEIARVFERNRLLFHMRNLGGVRMLEKSLLTLDDQTWAEIFEGKGLLATLRARASAFLAPLGEEVLLDRWRIK